jgi:hypothetical protein
LSFRDAALGILPRDHDDAVGEQILPLDMPLVGILEESPDDGAAPANEN